MPSKNSIKKYIENGFYHVYNRGVEKRNIFLDAQDYSVYLSYLKTYLLPKNVSILQSQLANPKITPKERKKIISQLNMNNFAKEISLLAYCLMPNHFHFLLKQNSINSMDIFINSLNTRYVMYFNKKYNRVGHLFQGVYKAVSVESDEQLVHLTSYIHRNPLKLIRKAKKEADLYGALTSKPSSLAEYLGIRHSSWINPKEILFYFGKAKYYKYRKFILKETSPTISFLEID